MDNTFLKWAGGKNDLLGIVVWIKKLINREE